MRTPVYFNGEITAEEIGEALREHGLHMRSDGHRLVVDRVPAWLRKDHQANVVAMPVRARKVAR